uniref:Uncharacterized protein n=1 Tax=Anguilla anguilla TaxID=7936 RepID=A0A0E9VHT8_ANGAN
MRFSSEVQMPSVIMWFGSVVHSPSPRAATVKPDSASFTGKNTLRSINADIPRFL